MISVQVQSPSPDPTPTPSQAAPAFPPTLADLSRNASVISSSSSSSSSSSLVLPPPPPRPIRTFSSPRVSPARARSPVSPTTPRTLPSALAPEQQDRAPASVSFQPASVSPPRTRAQSRVRGSRNSSAGPARISPADFDLGDILGEGSYSTVLYGRYRATGQEYAIKVLDKNHLKRNNKLPTALAEKDSLVRLGAGHPGIVRLHFAFQDEWSLYFVLDYAPNGELQSRISKLGSLSTPCARVYAAQLVDALDYMHNRGVIHRDLKPENLLLDEAYRIRITDFGTGKVMGDGTRSKTFVGTAQYVSPELLESSETSQSSDLWALGCIIYQMIAGRFAFHGLSEYLTWQKIKALEYHFPDGFDPDAQDLIKRLLVREPAARLGAGPPGSANSMQALRGHAFFAPIQWKTLWTDPVPPLEPGLVRKALPSPGSGSFDDLDLEGKQWDIGWDDVPGIIPRGPEEEDEEEEEEEEYIEEYEDDAGTEEPSTPGEPTFQSMRRPQDEMEWAQPGVLAADYQFGQLHSEVGAGEVGYGYAGGGADTAKLGATSAAAGEEGPLGEAPRYEHAIAAAHDAHARERTISDASEGSGTTDATDTTDTTVPSGKKPTTQRGSFSTTESSSSGSGGRGGGSPVRRLSATLEALGLDRGRTRAQTPVQGNSTRGVSASASGSSDDHARSGSRPVAATGPVEGEEDWSPVLMPGEKVLLSGPVEAGAMRRRASRLLLPLPAVAGRQTKARILLLTDRRILCLKMRKTGLGIKTEVALRSINVTSGEGPDGSGSKTATGKATPRVKVTASPPVISTVEMRGARHFEILTTDKSQMYATSTTSTCDEWVRRIRDAIDEHGSPSGRGRPRPLSTALTT